MTTIQSADYTAFKQFATFQSIEELNHAVRRFLYTHSHELTPSTIQTLKIISRFSCKIFGVCWTKIDTLASAVGISRSSVERAIRTLKQYGILTVQKTTRKIGGQGHNIYVISTYDVPNDGGEMTYRQNEESAAGTSVQPTKVDTEAVFCETVYSGREKDSKDVKSAEPTLEQLDASYTPRNVPDVFVETVKPFVSSAYGIYRLWGTVNASMRYMGMLDASLDVIVDAFKQSVFAYKAGKIKKDLGAYFYGTLCSMFAIERRKSVDVPDWLQD